MSFAWTDLLHALALVLIIEGLLPFTKPALLKKIYAQLLIMSDKSIRLSGLASLLAGVLLLLLT
ncbi:MAG: hypothetical protein CR991_02050 [Proteobacteria bacterium]|nr:MAG: hypothetical protein CR991_02050 [Pseudomonadota bacterium]